VKVIIAIDESATVDRIVEFIHSNHWLREADIKLIYAVVPIALDAPMSPYPAICTGAIQKIYEYAQTVVRQASDRLKAEIGKPLEWAIPLGDAAHSIIDEAKSWSADLIVMGTHSPHGLQKLLCGSVSQAVAAGAPCSVLVLKVESEASQTAQ